MQIKKIISLYKKEIRDVLRDKKTILMMVVIPLILYPLIMFGSIQVMSMIENNEGVETYRIGLGFDTLAQEFTEVLKENAEDESYKFEIFNLENVSASGNAVTSIEELEQMLSDGELDAYLTLKEGEEIAFTISYFSSGQNSRKAAEILKDKLAIFKEQVQQEVMRELIKSVLVEEEKGEEAKFKENLCFAMNIDYKDIASAEESVGNILGSMLPFLLVISLLMGAIYPAIDVTAGERERGTLETMLTLPITNIELLSGKFLAVATIAIVSAILNIVSMSFMGVYLYQSMAILGEEAVSMDFSSFLPIFLVVFLCVLTFALLLSALSMCFCSFARSFKEANNYITPLMLIVMLASYVGFIPNVELTTTTAVIPVVNISLLIRDVFHFSLNYSLIAVVLLSNVIYSLLAVFLLGRIYDSEQILFSSETGGFRLLESRKNIEKGGLPSIADAILIISIVLLLFLYFGSLLQMKFLLNGVMLSEFLIAGIVIIAAIYAKNDYKTLFSLRVPSLLSVVGSIIFIFGGYFLAIFIAVILSPIMPGSSQVVNETFGTILDGIGFWQAALIIAVIGPICEEIVFRGYLFSGLRSKGNVKFAILFSSLIFGIYHMSLLKLFTTGFLGILLCLAVEFSGSIFVPMLMHIINNAFSVILMFYGNSIEKYLPFLTKEKLSIGECATILIIGVAFIGIGGIILYKNRIKKEQPRKIIKNE